jgi:hypothetical protein
MNTVQFKLERIGWAACHTPGCGQADLIAIGRFVKIICQRCGGAWGTMPAVEKAAA